MLFGISEAAVRQHAARGSFDPASLASIMAFAEKLARLRDRI